MTISTFATVTTSLGDEMLMLTRFSGREALGQPFQYDLDLLSHDPDVEFASILNRPVKVTLELKEGEWRYIHGIATRFGRVGESGRHTLYRVTLRPWLWLLTRSTDSRIFHEISIPDVIQEVFKDHDCSDFDVKLSRDYRKWEYLVQYRETAFNFVHRLMEQEGLYYYFEHTDGKHTLVITDSYAVESTLPGYHEIPYFPPAEGEQRERDHIDGWRVLQEIQTASCVLNDFDFKKPKAELIARRNPQFKPDVYEFYDYPGEYDESQDAEAYVRLWKEQIDSQHETVEGQGNVRGLVLGSQFSLTGFPRKDQNRKYVVTYVACTFDTGALESTRRASSDATYRCSFRAIDQAIPFRPARETPKPEIRGPQTAIVVGYQPGEEIHTDRYGRVRVRFHWVRKNEHEKMSCWVRVAQVWAGARWGAIHIPRVGQEVIVEFLEGDPDRPIITGRVYNADNMPPYDLPANKTQSGIKSRSTKEGTSQNFNELRFEDKKGEEQLYMQAEKDMDTLVKNNQTLTVVASRTKDIGEDETTSIGQNRTESVVENETISIGGDRTETVQGTETISIAKKRTETVGEDESITIAGSREESVGGDDSLNVAKHITIDAGTSITIKTGAASITMKSNGDIVIDGKNVSIKGSGRINAKAAGNITLKGSNVGEN